MNEVLISVFVAAGALLLFVVSRKQAHVRRRNDVSRSNARVVREVKRIAVRDPGRIIEVDDR